MRGPGYETQKAKLRLTVLSPLHIGSGMSRLTRLDYFLDDGKVRVVHQGRLAALLARKGRIEDYSRSVEQKGSSFDLGLYVKEILKLSESEKDEITKYVVSCKNRQGLRELIPQTRDVRSIPFIPGSSIKGAIRTACIYGFIKGLREGKPNVYKKLIGYLIRRADKHVERKKFFEDLEKLFLMGYKLPKGSSRGMERDGYISEVPNTDIFRCLQVSDAYPVKGENLHVEALNVVVVDKNHDGSLSDEAPLFVEAVVEGSYEFEVSFDMGLLKEMVRHNVDKLEIGSFLSFGGVEDILRHCAEFVADQIRHEKRFFGSCKENGPYLKFLERIEGKASFRLGWGSGLVGAGVDILLPKEIKDTLKEKYFPRRDKRIDDFPKSRRVAKMDDGSRKLMGFCRLELVDQ